jgi:hypothetical protein
MEILLFVMTPFVKVVEYPLLGLFPAFAMALAARKSSSSTSVRAFLVFVSVEWFLISISMLLPRSSSESSAMGTGLVLALYVFPILIPTTVIAVFIILAKIFGQK